MSETDVRGRLKDIVSELQSKELVKRMIVSSKMDRVLLSGRSYNGKMMKYQT
jgi:hypothetical protein